MAEYNQGFPRSFSRSQTKSIWLLVLSFIPLSGCLIAVVFGLVKGSSVKNLHFVFQISNNHTLNNVLTVIGIFHALVGYAIRQLMDRVANQLRTRAFVSESASTIQLLNSLPGSPDWRILFKSRIARNIRFVGLFSGFLSVAGGILYKQGMVLSEIYKPNNATYPHVFMTNCTADFSNCNYSRYYAYGFALHQANEGGQFSKGVENFTDSDGPGYSLAFVSTPFLPSPVETIATISAKSFAMLSKYRNATLADLPEDNITSKAVSNAGLHKELRLSFHGHDDIDWSFSFTDYNLSHRTTQSVRGTTYYCIAESQWKTQNGSLFLQSSNITNCTRFILGTWGNVSAQGIAHALFSDITDWEVEDVLKFAYVVPTMYATIVLGRWDNLWRRLEKITLVKPLLTETVDCTQTLKILVVESKKPFLAYIIFLVLIFIAHWISGFMDTKVFVSEWAPLWFGLLSNSEQENVRKQIRGNLGLEGLEEEVKSEYIPLTLTRLEEEEGLGPVSS